MPVIRERLLAETSKSSVTGRTATIFVMSQHDAEVSARHCHAPEVLLSGALDRASPEAPTDDEGLKAKLAAEPATAEAA
jgi:hypothetical protein